MDSKQKELDKIRMEKVLEKAKEIERQISSITDDNDPASGNLKSSSGDVSKSKHSSGDKKRSRKHSRSVSRSRSRSR